MESSDIIFLIENDMAYISLLEEAFRKASIPSRLRLARYGNEAILYLKGVGIYGDRKTYPLPWVILLDTTNPDGSSAAVLSWIREQPEFAEVPILLLQTMEADKKSRKQPTDPSHTQLLNRDRPEEVIKAINLFNLARAKGRSEQWLGVQPKSREATILTS
jgi:CheY-like chemotaxis protein